MKKMVGLKKSFFLKMMALMMTLVMTLTVGTGTAFASGVEDLPYGTLYGIGGFTFTDTNTTPVKTVLGTSVSFKITAQPASIDAGIGDINLTVRLKDANTGAFITEPYVIYLQKGYLTADWTPTYNLGYYGREIQVWFDASSAGASNGHYRSVQVVVFASYVS